MLALLERETCHKVIYNLLNCDRMERPIYPQMHAYHVSIFLRKGESEFNANLLGKPEASS